MSPWLGYRLLHDAQIIVVFSVPKIGFGTAGLFKDTKSSVLVALTSGYR